VSALTRACKALSLAQAYAEDGAVVSAIEYGTEAMALLFQERDRRKQIGLIPAAEFETAPPGKAPSARVRQGLANARKVADAAAKRRKR
jgi:hypothetical protein